MDGIPFVGDRPSCKSRNSVKHTLLRLLLVVLIRWDRRVFGSHRSPQQRVGNEETTHRSNANRTAGRSLLAGESAEPGPQASPASHVRHAIGVRTVAQVEPRAATCAALPWHAMSPWHRNRFETSEIDGWPMPMCQIAIVAHDVFPAPDTNNLTQAPIAMKVCLAANETRANAESVCMSNDFGACILGRDLEGRMRRRAWFGLAFVSLIWPGMGWATSNQETASANPPPPSRL